MFWMATDPCWSVSIVRSKFTIRFFSSPRYVYLFVSCASAKAERSLFSLSRVCVYVCRSKSGDPPPEWHIHWEFLDFKSGFGFTIKIYPILIFIFKWMPSNLFLILQNYLRPFQQWMPLSSPNTQPIRMQGQQKILPPAGEGHSSNENAW